MASSSWQPTGREDHELLHGKLVAGVAAAVDDVESWDREDELLLPGKITDMAIQRHALQHTK